LSAVSSFVVGLFLLVTPWTRLWDANYLLQPTPFIRELVLSTFARGTVSGLGLLNILLAVHDVREHFVHGRR
jgi:hypothetical protein